MMKIIQLFFFDDDKVFEGKCLGQATLLNLFADKKLTDIFEYVAIDSDDYSYDKCINIHDYIECSIPLPI